jgi:hypothetical protein
VRSPARSLLAVILLASAVASSSAQGDQSVGVEILGRSMLYGVAYERELPGLPLSAGLGLSRASVEASEAGGNEPRILLVPVYAVGRLFGEDWIWSGGVTWLASQESTEGRRAIYGGLRFGGLPFILNAGVGREWRASDGFTLRANLLVQAAANVAPGLSLNLAYRF